MTKVRWYAWSTLITLELAITATPQQDTYSGFMVAPFYVTPENKQLCRVVRLKLNSLQLQWLLRPDNTCAV
jgi:hypothetical protein